jgi:hypothetical protein
MSEEIDLDAVRSGVLAQIERNERNFRLAFFAAVVWEGLFILAFILVADFSNRMHVLLLLATIGSYSIVVLGLVALGAHMNRGVLRVLRAIEFVKA